MLQFNESKSDGTILDLLCGSVLFLFIVRLHARINIYNWRFSTIWMVFNIGTVPMLHNIWSIRETNQPCTVKKVITLSLLNEIIIRWILFIILLDFRIPIRVYILLAILTLGTMGFSNSSLGYLNYPTQVIFKSCKLIPVLIGSMLIQGKRYGPLDFIAAILMCIGLTLFTLGLY